MEIDAEMRRKIFLSVAVVVLFTVALVYVGFTYDSNGLSADGGFALVVVITAFIVLMAGAGFYLSRTD